MVGGERLNGADLGDGREGILQSFGAVLVAAGEAAEAAGILLGQRSGAVELHLIGAILKRKTTHFLKACATK